MFTFSLFRLHSHLFTPSLVCFPSAIVYRRGIPLSVSSFFLFFILCRQTTPRRRAVDSAVSSQRLVVVAASSLLSSSTPTSSVRSGNRGFRVPEEFRCRLRRKCVVESRSRAVDIIFVSSWLLATYIFNLRGVLFFFRWNVGRIFHLISRYLIECVAILAENASRR